MSRSTRATIDVHQFFFLRFLNLEAQDLSQKLIWVRRKMKLLLSYEKSHGLGTQRESCKKTNGLIFFFFPTILG